MKSFSTYDGDVVVGKTIEMVEGSELLRQKIERVIGTNKGEWSYDADEGIDFGVVFRKNPDENEIRATIEEALVHIDETLTIAEFSMKMTGRTAEISFTVVNGDGEEIGGGYTYGGN